MSSSSSNLKLSIIRHTTGFCPQTQKLKPTYLVERDFFVFFTLGLKG